MNKNKVELIGTYGSDETHALSAWTSTSRDLTEDKRGRINKLLDMLASNGHHSPFEKSSQHFLVTSEIASHIHLLKHRVSVSINSESARYKELKDDKYYVPTDWDANEQSLLILHLEESIKKYHDCLARLKANGMSAKRAKESARFYLPYGNQITADVMFNFRSFMHFIGLRNSEHAQLEIRDIAKQMLIQVYETGQFNLSLEAFGWTKKKYMSKTWYVYHIIDPETNKVFYIGKGHGQRAYIHMTRALKWNKTGKIIPGGNKHLYRKLLKIYNKNLNPVYSISFSSSIEKEVLDREENDIKIFGLENLCNLTHGGEGETRSKESLIKLSNSIKKFWNSDDGQSMKKII